jgi:SAM-dependent methyltransferase
MAAASNNPQLTQFLPLLIARAGIDRAYLDQYRDPPPPKLPSGASEFLRSSNPRLAELRQQYRFLESPAVQHSLWNSAYVQADLPLQCFRGDCAFVWQQRDLNLPCTYLLTYYFLCASGYQPLLDRLPEDELFGVYTMDNGASRLSRDRLDSAMEIAFLDRMFGISRRPNFRILDVGSGYGRLAHRLTQAYDNVSVFCVDAVPESTFLCEYYVRFRGASDRVQVVPLGSIESLLADTPIDLAVNVHSFSECTYGAICWWLDLLAGASVPHLMIVPNADWHGGRELFSFEPDRTRKNFRPLLEERGYRLTTMEPKYREASMQQFGITPTHYFLFSREL